MSGLREAVEGLADLWETTGAPSIAESRMLREHSEALRGALRDNPEASDRGLRAVVGRLQRQRRATLLMYLPNRNHALEAHLDQIDHALASGTPDGAVRDAVVEGICDLLAENWDVFMKHRPYGGYAPVGDLAGDCKECGGEWPCDKIRDALAGEAAE